VDVLPSSARRRSHSARRRAWCALAVAVSSLLAAPVATWWLVGDQSEPGGDDYLFKPPRLSAGSVRAAGLVALVIVVLGVILLARSTSNGRVASTWWYVEVPIVVAGIVTGYSLRVMTAAVGGANIGGGLALYALPVFLFVVLATEAALSARLVVLAGRP
jgi:hypothetical protein